MIKIFTCFFILKVTVVGLYLFCPINHVSIPFEDYVTNKQKCFFVISIRQDTRVIPLVSPLYALH